MYLFVAMAVEYTSSGVGSGTKCVKRKDRGPSPAVICEMLMANVTVGFLTRRENSIVLGCMG